MNSFSSNFGVIAIVGVALAWFFSVLASAAAYITNIVWLIGHHTKVFDLIIGLVGLFPPVGIIHGLGLWFHWW